MKMLAYVFWHWPRPDVDRQAYEDDLKEFHRALAGRNPPGFRSSLVFRLQAAPWIPAGRAGYEDWYLLKDSAALDGLNEAAVSGACQAPHDRVARRAEGGAGGLYRQRGGAPPGAGGQLALWFSKPPGISYDELYALLRPWTDQAGLALWQRQLVLGPAPEFYLLAPGRLELPAGLVTLDVLAELIWPLDRP
jgi:hypothetical protein